jgi:hypothetical protein
MRSTEGENRTRDEKTEEGREGMRRKGMGLKENKCIV